MLFFIGMVVGTVLGLIFVALLTGGKCADEYVMELENVDVGEALCVGKQEFWSLGDNGYTETYCYSEDCCSTYYVVAGSEAEDVIFKFEF